MVWAPHQEKILYISIVIAINLKSKLLPIWESIGLFSMQIIPTVA